MSSPAYATIDETSGKINAVIGQPQSAEAAPLVAPPGAPTVGMWVEERYCGLTTWLVTLVGGLPCSYFCPCDRRTVWVSGGVKYNEKGAVTDDYLFLNPCPPGSMCHPNPTA
ncbi:unnamed protein product [Ectocarpus sp. 12 AP-2014]